MVGRRCPDDTKPWDLEAGDYCLRNGKPWVCLPDGSGPACLDTWELTIHDDETITLSPSILDVPADGTQGWHGYLERGVWREC